MFLTRIATALFISSIILACSKVSAQGTENPYSPYVGRDYPTNVYFGDYHEKKG